MNKRTLVLGASTNQSRYSFIAMNKLIAHGHDIRAIGFRESEVNGIKIENSKKLFRKIDTVTLYLNKINQRSYYQYIVDLKPKRVIFNPGSENIEFENILKANGISFERSCTLTLLALDQY